MLHSTRSEANRAAGGEKCQGAVDTRARDKAVVEEREATGDQSAAYSSTAEPRELGPLRWLHSQLTREHSEQQPKREGLDERRARAVLLDSRAEGARSSTRSAQRDAQLKVLLNLLTSFFFTTTGDKPFSSRLVHFLAVLGINSNINCLRTAKNYLYMLAGVVYCMRVLSVEKLLPSACCDEQTNKDRKRFLEHREKYLADSLYSPISKALSLLAYSKQRIRDYNAATLQQAAAGLQHLCYRQAGDNSYLLSQVTVTVGQAKGGAALLAAAARAGYGAILGVLAAVLRHLSVRLIEAFRLLSAMWHCFLGLDRKQAVQQETWTGNMNPVKRTKKQACGGNNNRDNKEMRREPATQQRNNKEKAICKAMQQVLVIDGQTPLVVVLPTGGGKSLLFSVLACIEDAGVTAVVMLVRKHAQQQGAAVVGGSRQVSSCYYVKRLAAEAGTAEESPAAAVSDRAAYRNAPAGERRRAGNEHAASVRNIYLSEHCLANGAGGEGRGGADDEAEERRLGRAGDGRVYYWQQVSARADERLLGRQAGRVQQLRDSWVRLMRRRGLRVARRAERSERRVAAGARRAR
ncbi:hypothetical protein OPT61_g1626 [Boeremia exigua]|uniref:Uncharacterized protein n=1 Tax=Boeremia exigua TaxID=749465 RepID=A0ACC2IPU8_9PLEO|nr:hypothetical protein OPT61_g1626 [Boeremia exigua]